MYFPSVVCEIPAKYCVFQAESVTWFDYIFRVKGKNSEEPWATHFLAQSVRLHFGLPYLYDVTYYFITTYSKKLHLLVLSSLILHNLSITAF